MQGGVHGDLHRGIYVVKIKSMEIIKIGYSSKIHKRLHWLEKSLPFTLELVCCMAGSPADEKTLHRYYAAYRLQGEWFVIPEKYRNKISILAADLMAVLHAKQPLFVLAPAQVPSEPQDRPGRLVPPLSLEKASIERLCAGLPSPFLVREIADRLHRHPSEGYASIRAHCNTLVRQGRLQRLTSGRYARIDTQWPGRERRDTA